VADRSLRAQLFLPALEAMRKHGLKSPKLRQANIAGFTVEDHTGGLEYVHGDLSALIGTNPAYDYILADQLPPEMSDGYADRQLAVWGWQKAHKGKVFSLGSGWSVVILPLVVEGDEYTVSAFYKLSN
jgi:hypothetical protein